MKAFLGRENRLREKIKRVQKKRKEKKKKKKKERNSGMHCIVHHCLQNSEAIACR